MQLRYDFSKLRSIENLLGAKRLNFKLGRQNKLPELDIKLSDGLRVELDELQSVASLLAYEGRQVVLYIPDQGEFIDSVLNGDSDKGKKFHVAHCEILERMRSYRRLNRYIATTDLSGVFEVVGHDELKGHLSGRARLYVCQVCLNLLNYKQCKVQRSAKRLRDSFSLIDFFDSYSSCFGYTPAKQFDDFGRSSYTAEWKEISESARASTLWRCTECGVDLSDHKHLLHVHHIDGNKGHNDDDNLEVLCKGCHRLQPLHDHLFIPRQEMKLINALRSDAGFFRDNWDRVLRYSDPACQGVLGLAYQAEWPVPEVEFAISDQLPRVEAAWPRGRIAISLTASECKSQGWTVMDLSEALAFNF